MADQEFYVELGMLNINIDIEDRELIELTDLERVDMSIRKWEAIVAHYESKHPATVIQDSGRATCALCWKYNNDLGNSVDYCSACPVQLTTMYKGRRKFCRGTPYWDYENATEENDVRKALLAAKREVVFLKRVRELVVERDGEDG